MGSEGTAVGAAISTNTLPTPRGGDVLFIADKGLKGIVSSWVQCKVDGLARQAGQRFTHVAIALNGWLALEAVPAPITQASAASDSGLAQTFARLWEKAETNAESKKPPPQQTWSGMPLEYGVRMIVIPDILFDAIDKGADLAILRNSSAPPFGELLDPCDPALMARIGSAYSVDALRTSMEAELAKGDSALERALPPWLRLKAWIAKQVPRLDASARDLRSRASLTPQQWRWFDAHLPSAFPSYQQRPYFCSQLVLQLLQESRLLGPSAIQAAVTPTGLHKALSDLGWNDVTGSSYSAEAIAGLRTDQFLRATHQANFASLRMIQKMHECIQINAIKVDVIRAHIDELTGSLRTARDRLNKISSATPTQ